MQTPVIYLLQTSFWQMRLGCFENLVKVGQNWSIVVPKISKAYAEKFALPMCTFQDFSNGKSRLRDRP